VPVGQTLNVAIINRRSAPGCTCYRLPATNRRPRKHAWRYPMPLPNSAIRHALSIITNRPSTISIKSNNCSKPLSRKPPAARWETGTSGGWLQDNPTLQGVPSGQYLVDVLSGHDFQESLKDYRDLGYLADLLNDWLANMVIYNDMVDTRRQAYEERAPAVRERLENKEAAALQERWQHYRDLIDTERQQGNPVNLATSQEKQYWAMLKNAQQKLTDLPDEPRYRSMQAKAEWLQGVLYWQIQSDYKIRLWEIEKLLIELQGTIAETTRMDRQVGTALDSVPSGFAGYDERIKALRSRILTLLPTIAAARGNASGHLQQLALDELEVRKQRLIGYRTQARYALARSYDQLATGSDEQP